jgi:hypothetical protein
MPINNSLNITIPSTVVTTTTATPITNSLSTTKTTIPLNISRKGLTIFNPLSSTVYVDFGTDVTASDYMFKLDSGAYYEMPQPIYTGAISMILASGTGSVEIRELI